jgi:short chain dehydrogenase
MFKDLFSLQGRIALVTSGSRGIGKMIAAGFLAQGAAKVCITARKAGPCEATAKELTAQYDGECIALPIDISNLAGDGIIDERHRRCPPSPRACGERVGVRGCFRELERSECAESPPHPPDFAEPVIGRAFARPGGFAGRPLPASGAR